MELRSWLHSMHVTVFIDVPRCADSLVKFLLRSSWSSSTHCVRHGNTADGEANRRGVIAVINSATANACRTNVTTQSVFFAAWTAAVLFGSTERHSNYPYDSKKTADWPEDNYGAAGASNGKLEIFRRATRRLALTALQQSEIDSAVSGNQHLMTQLREELRAAKAKLSLLHPSAEDYSAQAGSLGASVGMLSTQLCLVESKLKEDIYAILTVEQRSLLPDLHDAFMAYGGRETEYA